ncbi:MAG: hypothetical protein WEA10_03990 [Actinomycetota bacterium]
MADANLARRPGGVTFIMILAYLEGFFTVLTGVIILIGRDNIDLSGSLRLDSDELLWMALVVIAVGIAILAIANALGRGDDWARIVVAVFTIFSLVSHVFVLFRSGYGASVLSSIISIGLGVLVLYLLFNERAAGFFGARH